MPRPPSRLLAHAVPALLCLAPGAAFAQEGAGAATLGTLGGTVVERATGRPVPGAEVLLLAPRPGGGARGRRPTRSPWRAPTTPGGGRCAPRRAPTARAPTRCGCACGASASCRPTWPRPRAPRRCASRSTRAPSTSTPPWSRRAGGCSASPTRPWP
jgi:hypothetical protein